MRPRLLVLRVWRVRWRGDAVSARERPILFSGKMVRAILDGRKTQTRRVMRVGKDEPEWASVHVDGSGDGWIGWSPHAVSAAETLRFYPGAAGFKCPYGRPGDRLWVRETFRVSGHDECRKIADCAGSDHVHYKADKNEPPAVGIWRPSIFMPRWASRIDLEILSVRAERLQDISEEDARAEGMTLAGTPPFTTYRGAFAYGWDTINGKRAPWASNPWVWVVGFQRVTP